MHSPSDDELEMLKLAMSKAEKLLHELIDEQQALEKHPPKLPAAKLVEGRLAMENAIASTRRMLTAMREAWEMARRNRTEFEKDPETD